MVYKKHRKLSEERYRYKKRLSTLRSHNMPSMHNVVDIGSPLLHYAYERDYYDINGCEYYDIVCILSIIASESFDGWAILSRFLRNSYIRLSDIHKCRPVIERW